MSSRDGARERRARRLDHVERLRHGEVGARSSSPGQGARKRPAALQREGIARDVVGADDPPDPRQPGASARAPAEVLELRARLVPARLSRAEARHAHGRRARLRLARDARSRREPGRRRPHERGGRRRPRRRSLYPRPRPVFVRPPTDWIAAFKRAATRRDEEAAATARSRRRRARRTRSPRCPSRSTPAATRTRGTARRPSASRAAGSSSAMDHTPNMVGELEHWQYDTFKTRLARSHDRGRVRHVRARRPTAAIEQFKMAAVSPLADFSFDYHDLLFRPVKKKPESR